MRPRQDYSRSRDKDYFHNNYHRQQPRQMATHHYPSYHSQQHPPQHHQQHSYQHSQQHPHPDSQHIKAVDKNPANIPNIIHLYNIPEHFNKDDICYFLYKKLQDQRNGLIKKSSPIIRSEHVSDKNYILVQFRSREEALNCLQLNGIYYGNRAFYMKSQLQAREVPILDISKEKIRKIQSKVQDGFNKIFIGNLPDMEEYEVIDMLTSIGQLKAFQQIPGSKTQNQYFCQFKNRQKIEQYLTKLNELKIKSRSIIAKRAALMNTSETSKSKVRARRSMFQKDLNSFYLTLDIEGYFKSMKISCVLLLKNIISNFHIKQEIMKDIRKQVEKIGPVIKLISHQKNVYIQYQKVEYAQIAYLIVSQRKFQNKTIDISFYDPVHFADELLI